MSSTRFTKKKATVDAKKTYPLDEAVALVKSTSAARFDGTVEVHVNLGIDTGKSDQNVRGSTMLPHGSGKTKKIMVFAESAKQEEAKSAGADTVGGEELIAEIKNTGKFDADVAIATPAMMPKLASVAKILGPKGLMPSPKNQTITPNLAAAIAELKKGKMTIKNDPTGNIHVPVGKVSWDALKLIENIRELLSVLPKLKPSSSKGTFIKSVTLSSTMGPGIKINF
ncbi:50S ribosomal protein L1 [Candidatus Uhrbacteria bacterium]|nr:50S ribosomal protein L1 [Candidatus Uhrbacteria bacterium]